MIHRATHPQVGLFLENRSNLTRKRYCNKIHPAVLNPDNFGVGKCRGSRKPFELIGGF